MYRTQDDQQSVNLKHWAISSDLLSSNDNKYLYNLACYAKEALTLRNNSDFITIHYDFIVFSMYIYIYISFFSMEGYL